MRSCLAFVIAPLWVPVVTAIWLPHVIALWMSFVVGYGGTLLLGVPIFLALRAFGWTSGWLAPPLGILCGIVLWMATGALFAFLLGQGLQGAYATVTDANWLDGLPTASAIGAAVAVTFWLISRPDRAQISN